MTPKIVTEGQARAIAEKVLNAATAPVTFVTVTSNVSGYSRFARNEISAAGDTQSYTLQITSNFDGNNGIAATNQFDDASITATLNASEHYAREGLRRGEPTGALGPQDYLQPGLWFDETLTSLEADFRAGLVRSALDKARDGAVSLAGFLSAFAASRAVYNNKGLAAYARSTNAGITVTARTSDGMGSGWAGAESNDWGRLDVQGTVDEAIGLAHRMVKPVAVEPGRYTVVLEPHALAAMFAPVIRNSSLGRAAAEQGLTVFADPAGGTRIGQRMLDTRLSVVADPEHPTGPFHAFDVYGTPINRTVWFENGVLRNLASAPLYPLGEGGEQVLNTEAFQMSGGDTSVAEMIASTRRGFWINRLSSVSTVDRRTMLQSGVTRDGIFLIEDGEITRPVRNFRFLESPFFILNNLEMLGEPVRVPGLPPAVVPAVKVRDFTFTSLSDAV